MLSLQLFTIGHSTHSLDRFLFLLAQYNIKTLADIRRFPGSRKFPHFNKENLTSDLPPAGIEYHWLEALGGRRPKQTNSSSRNLGLRNESFRNYADYMLTEDFRAGMRQLLTVAAGKPTAFMCSESVFWRCHRRLVSDYLLARYCPTYRAFSCARLFLIAEYGSHPTGIRHPRHCPIRVRFVSDWCPIWNPYSPSFFHHCPAQWRLLMPIHEYS